MQGFQIRSLRFVTTELHVNSKLKTSLTRPQKIEKLNYRKIYELNLRNNCLGRPASCGPCNIQLDPIRSSAIRENQKSITKGQV